MDEVAADGPRKRGRPTRSEREQRREQILDAAVRLFLEHGYGGVSLDRLAAEAKVTKRTIYVYVGDKTAVFTAVVGRLNRDVFADGETTDLEALTSRLVLTLHSDVAVGLHRLVIAEAKQFPELAGSFYAAGPQRYVDALSALLGPSAATGEQLFALLLGEPHRRRLLGLEPAPSPAEAERHASAALAALGLRAT
ncbi:TetR/AcrR family transcriptional regulator [Kribbella sp. NPDC048915]|uniref:TetR/AcrR family transcriptional regulator n=1 Tax=Kribbella sp. NPDC048915 TaxID=3155148 RepID=UPI0033FEA346